MKSKRYGFPDVGAPPWLREQAGKACDHYWRAVPDGSVKCQQCGDVRGDPAVEAAVDGIAAELGVGICPKCSSAPCCCCSGQYLEIYCKRCGVAFEFCKCPPTWEQSQAEAMHTRLSNPVWDRVPSADLDAGVAVDGTAVFGAACLVALVVFFVGAVIWGVL